MYNLIKEYFKYGFYYYFPVKPNVKGGVHMAEKHIHSGHRQRMKQRFLNYPAEFMYDHELLEIALYYTRPVVNTNDTAHDLISANGSLSKVLGLPVSELEKVKGIGSGSAFFIKILHEGILRYLAHSCENTVLSSVSDIKAMFEDYFRDSDTELCCITTVSPSMSLMSTICLPYSDVADNSISQRELAQICELPQSSIARMEAFTNIPKVSTVMKVIKPLGLKLQLVNT